MQLKDFWELAEQRLGKDRVAEIQKQAELEYRIYSNFQNFIMATVEEYMTENKIGPKELAKLLHRSSSYIFRLRKGAVNLKISDFAHLMARLGKDPDAIDILRSKK